MKPEDTSEKKLNRLSIQVVSMSNTQLKQETQEAIAEIERGDFVSINEAFKAAKNAIRGTLP